MSRTTYSFILYLLSPIILLYFCFRALKSPGYLANFRQRFGFVRFRHNQNTIHIHCASVGETRAAIPLIKKIAENYPNHPLLITTTSPTGKNEVLKLINTLDHGDTTHCYLPIDWSGSCKRFITQVKPSISILMETELWPNLLYRLNQRQVPVLLANARLSDSSFNKYNRHPQLSNTIFSSISCICAQYQSDSENFQRLGTSAEKIVLTGSIKFDIELSQKLRQQQNQLKQQWTNHRKSWIAASIHPGEFSAILDAHLQLLNAVPDALLIAVPRHPERFDELKVICKKRAIPFVSRSENKSPTLNDSVLIGDTMGEMLLMCGAADVAFVGGSLIIRGGQNPIELAACGLPVIMGPSDYNFSDITQIMQDTGALERVESASELTVTLAKFLSDNNFLEQKSLYAKQIFENNRGAVDKTLVNIEKLLHS